MKLRFYAKGTLKVSDPLRGVRTGAAAEYAGRRWESATRSHPATEEPYEVEAGTPAAARMLKLVRRDSAMWPADAETASACGVPFVPVEFDAGEWIATGSNS